MLMQRDEPAGLRRDREERGDRRGRALVGVGRPEVERHRADLEREPDERQEDRDRRAAARSPCCADARRRCSESFVVPVTPKISDMP